ncbi:MAG: type II/IV secretion system protein [Patescibacteria group bacterium]|nr:type II/IV secretion system protein [Patescibacteria group bacterium]
MNDTDQKLAELRRKEEEELAMILSKKYGIEYRDLTRTSINVDALQVVPEKEAREAEVAGFDLTGSKLSLAVRSPAQPKLASLHEELEKKGYAVTEFMVSRDSLERAWEHYKDLTLAVSTKRGVIDVSPEELKKAIANIRSVDDIRHSIEVVSGMQHVYRISKILEVILAGAFAVGASDIHIEPEDKSVRLRYRLDGVLNDITNFDPETHKLLLSRLKLLSGLKLNVRDASQDGRFSIVLDDAQIEVRTSVIPGSNGETVVMRLLNPDSIAVSLSELGMEPKLRALVEREIRNPNGMLLNTGPTGSGKTTTLYACMREINSSEVKIITIEDPVEYHLAGVVQTQVEKNYTFLQGLRSALRQDPDVIMVGEIRDEEVAKTAIDAALTGHFVFSTLHTNNAAGTFPRLGDLGVDPKVFGSAINVAMAQRLVRKLCDACKKKVPLEGKEKELVEKTITGLRDTSQVPKDISSVYEPVGCSVCHNTGFKGRIGVFEAIVVDAAMGELLRTLPSEHDIQKIQATKDLLTMSEDGVLKVLSGVTSFYELNRVVLVGED